MSDPSSSLHPNLYAKRAFRLHTSETRMYCTVRVKRKVCSNFEIHTPPGFPPIHIFGRRCIFVQIRRRGREKSQYNELAYCVHTFPSQVACFPAYAGDLIYCGTQEILFGYFIAFCGAVSATCLSCSQIEKLAQKKGKWLFVRSFSLSEATCRYTYVSALIFFFRETNNSSRCLHLFRVLTDSFVVGYCGS